MKHPQLFAGCMALSLSSLQARADFSCSDVLKWGIFNQDSLHSFQMSTSSFHSWQCTNEINTREEARKLGFGLGAVIEGLPFDANGNVNKARRDEWRRTNCTEEDRKFSSSTSLDRMTMTASSAILTAWNTCVRDEMERNQSSSSLVGCIVEHGNARQVQIGLTRTTPSETQIRVKSIQLFGAKDQNAIKMQSFPITHESLSIERQELQNGKIPEFRLVVNTDGGNCVATFPEFIDVHQGTIVLGSFEMSQDYSIRGEKVILPEGLTIRVGRGAKLLIEAHEVEIGNNVVIDGTGEVGRNGASAPEPPNESFPGQDAIKDACSDALVIYKNTRGQSGENGKDGGSGATIEILAGKVSGPGLTTIKVKNAGGPGGRGGKGARFYKTLLCVAGGYSRWDSPMGLEGYPGQDGSQGMAGPPPIIGGAIYSHFIEPPLSR